MEGVVSVVSDQDMTPPEAYQCYQGRWILEIVIKYYKSDIGLDTTNVQGDYAVMGSEFINLLASIITCRIVKKSSDAGLLEKMTYGDLMEDLSSAWRKTEYTGKPRSYDKGWVHTLPNVKSELELLGLSTPLVTEKKKPGRPKKQPVEDDTPGNTKVTKKRGRPRKNPEDVKPKRPVGRPKKQPAEDDTPGNTKVAKKRGRPRKNPEDGKPKRPVRRPKKQPAEDDTP